MAIRVIAIGVVRRGSAILVFEGRDPLRPGCYFRPLGGGVEDGEHSREALAREFREEIGAEIVEPRLLGVLENRFQYDGKPRHEIVFVYECALADRALYERERFEVSDEPFGAAWQPLDGFGPERRLVPEGLQALLAP